MRRNGAVESGGEGFDGKEGWAGGPGTLSTPDGGSGGPAHPPPPPLVPAPSWHGGGFRLGPTVWAEKNFAWFVLNINDGTDYNCGHRRKNGLIGGHKRHTDGSHGNPVCCDT